MCMQNFTNKIEALDAAMNFSMICTDPVLEIVVSESNVLKPTKCKTRDEVLLAIKNAKTFWIRVSDRHDCERCLIFVYTV